MLLSIMIGNKSDDNDINTTSPQIIIITLVNSVI